ncbi:MAG: acyl-CoA dehydrogenase family protein, partial [Cycloclasticus sp.]
QDAVDITIDYTKQRKAFGKPLIANQEIYFKLAEMQTDIQSVRALIYHACEKYINGEDVDMLTSMAKFKVGALGQTIPSACLQYWGGQGFMWDNLISRIFRDTRLCSIGGGANEVMLEIISKRMGIHPTSLK